MVVNVSDDTTVLVFTDVLGYASHTGFLDAK